MPRIHYNGMIRDGALNHLIIHFENHIINNGYIQNSPDFVGEEQNTLVWQVPVSPAWYGDFHCGTGTGPSRTFTVKEDIIIDPSVFLNGPFDGIIMSTHLNNNGYIILAQPFNQHPGTTPARKP
ncbi:MAG: hypothetical protein JW861_02880 [Bacteroidales bacterium]|nr:hypothetical protein [Bacteroidales bacterium]